MKIGITADCSSGLEYAPFEHQVKITRTTIHFGDENLTDGIDITANEFYDRLSKTDVVPSTSAPSPIELVSRFEEWKAEGCTDVIHFPISWGLSEYGKNLEASMSELVSGIKIHSFNSNTACLMEGYLAHYAEICVKHGLNVEETLAECTIFRDHLNAYFVVDDLKYLVKNGRLSGAAGFIGSLVKIKPILNLGESGKIETFEKVRTHKKAIDRICELIANYGQKFEKCIYITLHTAREADCVELKDRLTGLVNNAKRIELSTITPTVGAHIGCGILGIACLPLDGLRFADEL